MEVNTSFYRVMVKQVSLFCTSIVQKMSITKVNICSIYVKDGNSAKKIEILLRSLLDYTCELCL